jgi:hypothetical protein
MQMNKKEKYILLTIFTITLLVRLFLAFSVPNLTYDSYFHLRQVEHISETGLPLYNDPLSYGGRELVFLPFFHYFMAFFNLLLPIAIVAKIIPNIMMATIAILVFFISKKVTNNNTASLFSASIAGFLPVLYFTNAFIPETLFIPLIFLATFSFMNLKEKNYLYIYLISFLLLALTSAATFLILIGFGIYLLLSLLENKKINQAELEVIIFSGFFYIWTQLLFFKDVLATEGINFIWQNVPPQIIAQYFPQVSLAEALLQVSIIPFLAGIFVVYRSLFQLKNQKAFLLISFAVSTTILTWLRLIEFKLSLAFFGIILAILFASFYQDVLEYSKKTKLLKFMNIFPTIVIILLAVTMIYPAMSFAWKQNTPLDLEVQAFAWMADNLPPDAGVVSLLEEGHLVTYYGKKSLMDNQFGLIPDIEERFSDANSMFSTSFQTQAFGVFDDYDVQYIILTPHAKRKYNISNFKYFTPKCFERVYKNETRIYKVLCTIEKE